MLVDILQLISLITVASVLINRDILSDCNFNTHLIRDTFVTPFSVLNTNASSITYPMCSTICAVPVTLLCKVVCICLIHYVVHSDLWLARPTCASEWWRQTLLTPRMLLPPLTSFYRLGGRVFSCLHLRDLNVYKNYNYSTCIFPTEEEYAYEFESLIT